MRVLCSLNLGFTEVFAAPLQQTLKKGKGGEGCLVPQQQQLAILKRWAPDSLNTTRHPFFGSRIGLCTSYLEGIR
jgi:hypothetical protein